MKTKSFLVHRIDERVEKNSKSYKNPVDFADSAKVEKFLLFNWYFMF